MTTLLEAVAGIRVVQAATRKSLAVIVAGHNGSGKSTMWRTTLADVMQLPLVNADRMMLSILPEAGNDGHLVPWAAQLRDNDRDWMRVAQQGVQAFVGQTMGAKVPFAMETVFSYWEPRPDGTTASKIELIEQLQAAGYFVLLLFVGLSDVEYSIFRVRTRVFEGGHGIDDTTLRARFPRTQRAIAAAVTVADASILTDNSRSPLEAFTVCQVQLASGLLFNVRNCQVPVPQLVLNWLDQIYPV